MHGLTTIILAAGEGKRMRSRQPKVLHELCGRPLITYPLRVARTLADRIVLVVGPNSETVCAVAGDGVGIVEQRERLGTGHAVLQARQECESASGPIVVLPGDVPLLSVETIERLVSHHASTGAAATILTAIVERPHGYGRVLRQGGRVKRIVEDRDATDDEKRVSEINTSVYCFDGRRLWPALDQIKPDNDQGEYYLTDVIALLAKAGGRVEAISVQDSDEALGVNDRKQLATLAAIQRRRIVDRHMLAGVTIIDPSTTYIDDTVTIGADTVIYPNVVIDVASEIGSDCVVGTGCQIRATKVGDRVQLKPYCVLTDSVIEEAAVMGPFCHLRPKSHVGPGAEIGNFIELKKAKVGRKSKAHHVGYLGDVTIGEGANIGAGTIFVNYDGAAKHHTTVADGAFVGSNSSIVAPLTIGEGAYIAAGSVITKDVPPDALAVERAPLLVKEHWAARRRARRAAEKKKED
jgi:bifunctional UDP-N-acetylglucosamine pyrophosphorylase / glucosamine-1-phosphate N-acetyltransferase